MKEQGTHLDRWVAVETQPKRRVEHSEVFSEPGGRKGQAWHTVRLFHEGKLVSVGLGPSKRAAEQDAYFSIPKKYR